jgi:hypothetical protein
MLAQQAGFAVVKGFLSLKALCTPTSLKYAKRNFACSSTQAEPRTNGVNDEPAKAQAIFSGGLNVFPGEGDRIFIDRILISHY